MVKNVDNFDVVSISKESSIGCILEVDLEYLDELHKLYNDDPLASEKLLIPYNIVRLQKIKKLQANMK